MMEEIDLEELAMGNLPKKIEGKKAEPVSDKVKMQIKKLAKMVTDSEGVSIKDLKKLNATELKLMMKASSKLVDSIYRTKEMIREAMPKEAKKGRKGMGSYPVEDWDY